MPEASSGESKAVSRSEDTAIPWLILAWGNRSRGDDALGPLFLDAFSRSPGWLQENWGSRVAVLEDFQLQPEHVLDLQGREGVLFVDAALDIEAPYRLEPVLPVGAIAAFTHHLSPGSLLSTYANVFGHEAPSAWLLSIRATNLELGTPLTPSAGCALLAASDWAQSWFRHKLGSAEMNIHGGSERWRSSQDPLEMRS